MFEFLCWKYFFILIVLVVSVLYVLLNIYQKDFVVQIIVNCGGQIDDVLCDCVLGDFKQVGVELLLVVKEGDSLIVCLFSLQVQMVVNDVFWDEMGEDYVVVLNLVFIVFIWLSDFGVKLMVLGLDFQGGVYFVLQVDQKVVLDKCLDVYVEDVCISLCDVCIVYQLVECCLDNIIVVSISLFVGVDVVVCVCDVMYKVQLVLGYDVVGNCVIVSVLEIELMLIVNGVIEQNVNILCNCVNQLGVVELIIQCQGVDCVVVQLLGVQDIVEVKCMIGVIVMLEYCVVVEGNVQDVIISGCILLEVKVYQQCDNCGLILLNKCVIVIGDQMVVVQVIIDQNGLVVVSVILNNVGGQCMFDFIVVNVKKLMVVVYIECILIVNVVDGKEVCSFCVKEEVILVVNINGVFGKNFQIIGLDKVEVENLVKFLKFGLLVVLMDFVEECIVGFSLGVENVECGVIVVGFVFLFMLVFFIVYYCMFGVIILVVMLFNLLIVVVVMLLFGVMMMFFGFVGLVLLIGLLVDVNVLINECICEELCVGVLLKVLIVVGYEKVLGMILDVNFIGMLVGVVLYVFGIGLLKGFVVMMIVGILVLMFIVIIVLCVLVVLVYSCCKKFKFLVI